MLLAWLNLYIEKAGTPDLDSLDCSIHYRDAEDCSGRQNYEAATGSRAHALRMPYEDLSPSNHIAAFDDYDLTSRILGHTSHAMSHQYMEGIPKASALAYFEIFP